MKLFQIFFLNLCMTALCTSSTTGSHNHGLPLLINTKTHSQRQPEPHRIYKRQEDLIQDGICNQEVIAEVCDNGIYQEYANILLECNEVDLAREVSNDCKSNTMGTFCGELEYLLHVNVDGVCSRFSSICSSECEDLLMTVRDQLGCCVNIFNESSNIPLFSYSLWLDCGVQQVNETCLSSTVTLHPTRVDPICTDAVFLQRENSLFCKQQLIETINNRLSSREGCQEYTYPGDDVCNGHALIVQASITAITLSALLTMLLLFYYFVPLDIYIPWGEQS